MTCPFRMPYCPTTLTMLNSVNSTVSILINFICHIANTSLLWPPSWTTGIRRHEVIIWVTCITAMSDCVWWGIDVCQWMKYSILICVPIEFKCIEFIYIFLKVLLKSKDDTKCMRTWDSNWLPTFAAACFCLDIDSIFPACNFRPWTIG